MAEKFSTGFRDAINQTGSVKATMALGFLDVFGGTKPTDADTTEGSSVLLPFTVSGGATGLSMGTSTAGVLAKAVEDWEGVGQAAASTGTTATWCRWYDSNHTTGGPSTTAVRVDGSVGTGSSYELQMSNTTIVESNPASVSSWNFTFPAS